MAKTCKECGRTVDQLWSRGRCYFCSMKSYSRKKPRSPTSYKKPNPKTQLDIAFGEYIKKKNMTSEGGVYCFTSLRLLPLDQIEAGHFIARGCMRFRWDEYNVFPQSKGDNRWGGGKIDIYREHLVWVYGEEFIAGMEADARKVRRYFTPEIRELTAHYEGLIKELKIDPNIGTLTENGRILWKDAGGRYICLSNNKLKLI